MCQNHSVARVIRMIQKNQDYFLVSLERNKEGRPCAVQSVAKSAIRSRGQVVGNILKRRSLHFRRSSVASAAQIFRRGFLEVKTNKS